MKFGITIPRFVAPGDIAGIASQLAGIAQDADQAGLDSLWVMDHFFQIPPVGSAEEPMLEGYSALAYVAGITERVQLGTLVGGIRRRDGVIPLLGEFGDAGAVFVADGVTGQCGTQCLDGLARTRCGSDGRVESPRRPFRGSGRRSARRKPPRASA